MEHFDITEDMIFQCFAAAQQDADKNMTAAFFNRYGISGIRLSSRYGRKSPLVENVLHCSY